MSDTYRRYRAIKQGIMQCYQPRPPGHRENHLNTLAAFICGLVGRKHAHLPACADHAPSNRAKQQSLIERFRRFLKNDRHPIAGWFSPVAKELLSALAAQPLQFVMDGSVVGHGCIALMVSVVYLGINADVKLALRQDSCYGPYAASSTRRRSVSKLALP